jgi:hypothetical protein
MANAQAAQLGLPSRSKPTQQQSQKSRFLPTPLQQNLKQMCIFALIYEIHSRTYHFPVSMVYHSSAHIKLQH